MSVCRFLKTERIRTAGSSLKEPYWGLVIIIKSTGDSSCLAISSASITTANRVVTITSIVVVVPATKRQHQAETMRWLRLLNPHSRDQPWVDDGKMPRLPRRPHLHRFRRPKLLHFRASVQQIKKAKFFLRRSSGYSHPPTTLPLFFTLTTPRRTIQLPALPVIRNQLNINRI